jgi:hypothetical protein
MEYNNDHNTDFDLSQFDNGFNTTEPAATNDDPVPDGHYTVKVERVELKRSKTKGHPMLVWSLRITSGKYARRMLFKTNLIASERNLPWLKRDLLAVGLRLKKLSDLPHHLDELLDMRLEVTQRTKGEYVNVYINKRLASPPVTAADDDIPF